MMMLVAGAFPQTPRRVLGNWLWIRNLFWQVPVPGLPAQQGSRKKAFLRESKGRKGGPCRKGGERMAGRELRG